MWFFIFIFFFLFFMNACQDGLAKPVSFVSPLPTINKTLSTTLIYEESATAWLLQNKPALGNLSDMGTSIVGSSYLCYVNTTADAFILSIITTDSSYTLSTDSDVISTVALGRIAWMANRNNPARGGIPQLQIEGPDRNNLVLRGGNGEEVWRVDANIATMELHGSANFLLYDNNKSLVWQSYDHPADTMVLGQELPTDARLVSRTFPNDFSEGSYSMEIVSHNNLKMFYNHSSVLHPYFSLSSTCSTPDRNITKIIFWSFDNKVGFGISCEELGGWQMQMLSNVGQFDTVAPVLRLQPNGDLQVLQTFTTVSVFTERLCDLPMQCDVYTTCFLSNGSCSGGCTTDSGEDCTAPLLNAAMSNSLCPNSSHTFKMGELSGKSHFSNPYEEDYLNVSSSNECRDQCFRTCSCAASFYDPENNRCFLEQEVLHFREESNKSYVGFIKMMQVADSPAIVPSTFTPAPSRKPSSQVIIGVTVASLLICVGGALVIIQIRKRKSNEDPGSESDASTDGFVRAFHASLPTRFSYKDIQSITNNFAKILGCGGFGSVYEGVLQDATKVAVKRLDVVSRQGNKEFRAEVRILADMHHFNLIKLLGFCEQGLAKRLLVYEYALNGSLDTWLFGQLSLTWANRHQIAIGVASGLAYLHEECHNKVIHLDIKPQNILLDHNFIAKVADFGMSRLMKREDSFAITTMRGTPGYLAPEWLLQGSATEKMDVFSFGMVLLELIGGRKNYDKEAMEEDQQYFPAWAWKKVKDGRELEILDSKLLSSLENDIEVNQIRTMIKVSFLCNQEDAQCRPRMSLVVKMLEGEVEVPSFPLFNSLHTRIAESKNANDYSIDAISSIVLVGK